MFYLCSPLKAVSRVGQEVKTPPFHGGITGSSPVRGTKQLTTYSFFAALVKRLRRLPFTEESRVRVPYVVPKPLA